MEKSWIDTEEGRNALLTASEMPECLQVLTHGGKKHLNTLTTRVLDHRIADPDKDRVLLVAKAELDGAREMLKYLIQLLDGAAQPKKKSGGSKQ